MMITVGDEPATKFTSNNTFFALAQLKGSITKEACDFLKSDMSYFFTARAALLFGTPFPIVPRDVTKRQIKSV